MSIAKSQEAHPDGLALVDQRFVSMANHAPVLLWMARTDSLCTFFNSVWLDFTGRTLEEEWGVGWSEGVHPQDFQPCMDTYVEAFNQRKEFEMTYRLKRKDGEYRWILDRGIPLFNEGTFAGYIGSCIDISDLRNAKDALEVANATLENALKELRRSNEDLENFAFAASHDLQAPLRVICSFSELLKEGIQPFGKPELNQYCDTLIRSSQEMKGLIDSLLSYARLDQKRSATALPVNIAELVRGVLNQELTVGSELEVTLGTIAPVLGHPALLKRLFFDLLENAHKFRKPNAPARVRITSEVHDSLCTIRVEDNGIGISPDQHQKAFEMFGRCHTNSQVEGKGIGLAMCKKIIDIHQGKIWVESAPNEGAAFFFTLPLGK